MEWMAWTWPTAIFYIGDRQLADHLYRSRDQVPRGTAHRCFADRNDAWGSVFSSRLLGSAFINLAWLGIVGAHQPWGALIVCLIYAAAVFRWV